MGERYTTKVLQRKELWYVLSEWRTVADLFPISATLGINDQNGVGWKYEKQLFSWGYMHQLYRRTTRYLTRGNRIIPGTGRVVGRKSIGKARVEVWGTYIRCRIRVWGAFEHPWNQVKVVKGQRVFSVGKWSDWQLMKNSFRFPKRRIPAPSIYVG